MIGRAGMCLGVAALVIVLGASAASAQGVGLGAIGGAGGYGFGYYNYGQGLNNNYDHLPFYALYPPVYYSFPVARPYGYSPFAYPPGVATPDIAPVEYINPHVPKKSGPQPVVERVTGPRMYINPFVQQARVASTDANP